MAVKFNEWKGGPEVRGQFFDAMKQEARHPSAEQPAAQQPAVETPINSLYRAAACKACGWAGTVSKFMKKCPKCGREV